MFLVLLENMNITTICSWKISSIKSSIRFSRFCAKCRHIWSSAILHHLHMKKTQHAAYKLSPFDHILYQCCSCLAYYLGFQCWWKGDNTCSARIREKDKPVVGGELSLSPRESVPYDLHLLLPDSFQLQRQECPPSPLLRDPNCISF